MIWDSISAHGRDGLWFMLANTTINVPVYLRIPQEKQTFFTQLHNCRYFQRDGAPSHNAKTVKSWLEKQGIQLVYPWPGSSPDHNPIENCWVMMKKKVGTLKPILHQGLIDKIKAVWRQETTPEYCAWLVASMSDMIKAVLAAKGDKTIY